MNRQELMKKIEAYRPFNEQEEKDKEVILSALKNDERVFYRDNLFYHMSASCWIVNPKRDKVLLCYHKIYRSWTWLGGHADGNENLLSVALKEAKEESSLLHITPVTDEILSLEVLTVNGHVKKGSYVPSHLHLNVTYLLEANEADILKAKEDENLGLRWFKKEEVLAASSEPWLVEKIYPKLIAKMTMI